jgi:hypothetical protein
MIEVILQQEDYKDRMRKEYTDLNTKIDKLVKFIYGDKFGTLDITRRELLVKQLRAMEKYLSILAERMDVEHIEYQVDDNE